MPVRVVKTHNSVYEIDVERKQARRVSGTADPTACFTPEGEWRPYQDVIGFNDKLLFVWPEGAPAPHTVTSTVQEAWERSWE